MKKLLSFVLVLAAVAASAATYPNKFVTNATPENVAWFPILLYLPITNATGLATDGDGKIIAGSGGGTTYSNLTETGYVSGFRSNVVVTGNALGTTITPLLSLTNGTAAGSGAQQNSPALMLGGAGYNTTGSTSAPVSMGFVMQPTQGATPTASLTVVKSIGGAAPTSSGVTFGDSFIQTIDYITSGNGSLRWSLKNTLNSPKLGVWNLGGATSGGNSGQTVLINPLWIWNESLLDWSTNWPALRVESSTNNVTLGFRKGTNTTEFAGIAASALLLNTNYVAADFTNNIPGTSRLVISNDVLYFVTATKTNLISDGR